MNMTRMKLLFLLLMVCFGQSYFFPPLAAEAALKTRPETWFSKGTCSSMTIQDYKHAVDRTPARTRTITDSGVIHGLMDKIAALPTEGEMMISFAPTVPLLTLEFECETGRESVEFYGQRIKTPATSFYMRDDMHDKEIFSMIQELLAK